MLLISEMASEQHAIHLKYEFKIALKALMSLPLTRIVRVRPFRFIETSDLDPKETVVSGSIASRRDKAFFCEENEI